ncbi:hypothetical protein AAZX31_04G168100 [Glycine max]
MSILSPPFPFSLSFSFFFLPRSIYFICSTLFHSHSFFFLPPFEDDALVLLFSKCRTEMTEMPNEKLKD